MLKQHYVNQLFDCNNTSVKKTLLMQMPKVSFTQFCNELARVLGTRQCANIKTTSRSVAVFSVGVESEEEGSISKSQWKNEKKISAQSSQIKDLHRKLDSTIAENSQMWEFFNPNSLQTAFTNALQAVQTSSGHGRGYRNSNSSNSRQCKPFLGRSQEPQLSAGKDRTTDPEKSYRYCKDMRHELENCLCLHNQKEFVARKQSGEGLN